MLTDSRTGKGELFYILQSITVEPTASAYSTISLIKNPYFVPHNLIPRNLIPHNLIPRNLIPRNLITTQLRATRPRAPLTTHPTNYVDH